MRRVVRSINVMEEISECEFVSIWGVQVTAGGDLFCHEEVRRCPERHVWTIVESDDANDGNWYALPGFRHVNAHGYVVTIKPWDLDTPPPCDLLSG